MPALQTPPSASTNSHQEVVCGVWHSYPIPAGVKPDLVGLRISNMPDGKGKAVHHVPMVWPYNEGVPQVVWYRHLHPTHWFKHAPVPPFPDDVVQVERARLAREIPMWSADGD